MHVCSYRIPAFPLISMCINDIIHYVPCTMFIRWNVGVHDGYDKSYDVLHTTHSYMFSVTNAGMSLHHVIIFNRFTDHRNEEWSHRALLALKSEEFCGLKALQTDGSYSWGMQGSKDTSASWSHRTYCPDHSENSGKQRLRTWSKWWIAMNFLLLFVLNKTPSSLALQIHLADHTPSTS